MEQYRRSGHGKFCPHSDKVKISRAKKLIEVDLPLAEINAQAQREKSIRHGHPSTLHMWWARRPLAACRAVIFASLVDDPSSCPQEFPSKAEQDQERDRLHKLIEQLVKWETTDETKPDAREIIHQARYEIARSIARHRGETAPTDPADVLEYLHDNAPSIHDPFAGGGSIPLEVQRLGLRAIGSDLNPVAVLLNKAQIEIPSNFRNQPPVNPAADPMGMLVGKGKKKESIPWRGTAGLADDIRYYGRWMREQAYKRIGHLYPKARLSDGTEATVIAWLWTRTVPCPNPACAVPMPLMKTFQLSKRNQYWVKPVVERGARVSIEFVVQNHSEGVPQSGIVSHNRAICIACGTAMKLDYVREQARAGNMGERMTAIVALGDRRRLFLSPTQEHINVALSADPNWRPMQRMPTTAYKVSGRGYGITHWHELFTDRQLTTLTTFSDIFTELNSLLTQHGADEDYANAVCTYLAFAMGRLANSHCMFCRWQHTGDKVAGVFDRQAIPMVWDFAEANPFSNSTQNWTAQVEWVAKVVARLPANTNPGQAYQANAATLRGGESDFLGESGPVIVTDPPYYDNISYAELSDFFYVWLRPLLRDIYPDLCASILAPIQEEMIAAPRFENPRERFEELMGQTLKMIRARCSDDFPSSIFYAYKQQQEEREGRTSTGWETMLHAVVSAGFEIISTWPMRTERSTRLRALGFGALASSVVLVCRPRATDAPMATRRQFLDKLAEELPTALNHLTREGHIAPTDLAQAAIGPGMQIYSRYSRVETISGKPFTIRDALAAINQAIANYDEQQEGEFDPESRFCLAWFQQYGYRPGLYGAAELLAQAKNVAIKTLADHDRLLTAPGDKVQLLPLDKYSPKREMPKRTMTTWEGCFRMAYHLGREDGEGIKGAAQVARYMRTNPDSVERLARILYNHYDRADDPANAVIFNNLVTSWNDILTTMHEPAQLELQ